MVHPEGRPAPGAWVTAARVGNVLVGTPGPPPKSQDRLRLVMTDARGRFDMGDLPPGLYEVSVCVDSLPLWLAPDGGPFQAAVVSRRDRTSVDLAVTRQVSLQGSLRRLGGGAVAGGRVQVFRRGEDTPFAESRSDRQGRFTVSGLDRGEMVSVLVRTPEGQYRRVSTTPMRAGIHPLEIDLPAWRSLSRRRVVAIVALPSSAGHRFELDWISLPEDAAEGFRGTVSIDGEGRGDFECPPGVFLARLREADGEMRTWNAPRFFRVESGNGALYARVNFAGSK